MFLDTKILLLTLTTFVNILANFYIPDLPQQRYVELRDINLGAIFPIYGYDKTKPCGDKLRSTVILQFIESLVYAVDKINADDTILPQTKLGFVIVDDCLKETTTIAQSLSFVPQRDVCSCNDTCSQLSSALSASPVYDVVGVIGSMKSSNSIAAAILLGPAQVPQVSYASSSDELSDKTLYPYFFRVVPPDKYQVDGIVSLIKKCGWTYISIVYTEGSYGEIAYKNLKKGTSEAGICIGTSHKVAEGADVAEYDKIAKDLRDHARVVVLFTGPTNAKGVFSAVNRAGDDRKYIWIGSDAWAKRISNLGEFWKTALGAFTFTFYSEEVPAFTTWFKSKDPLTDKDPWFKEFWEIHFSCSLGPDSSNPCDPNAHLSTVNGFSPVSTVTPVMDAVQTFARSIHALLQNTCSDKIGLAARDCITGPDLVGYMKNLSFTGYNGHVEFDENGNLLGKYLIDQLVQTGNSYKQIKIGQFDTMTKSIYFNAGPITWEHVDFENTGTDIPESVCSKPCGPGEFRIQKELPCCWECRKCRDNEYIIENGTNCAPCLLFSWPDSDSDFKACIVIKATHILWEEPIAIILLAFSALGVAGTVTVLVLYVRQNNSKCIKASSREMSYLMLAGIFLGYLTVVGLVAPPDAVSCKINYFCFCVSFTWIYSPLLTRTTRIYRIFSNTKSAKRPRFISPKSQFFIASLLILVQTALSIIVCFVYNPTSQLSMPVRTERYVELSCDFTVPGLASFLSYNLVLVVVCSFFAFKTRKLPDNFNESRFISMCVYTTLVLLLAFIPSYFTAGRQYLRTVMLSTVLILNKTVAICFLYLPKIYASFYLENEGQGQAGTSRYSRNTQVSTVTSSTGRTTTNFLQVEPVG